MTLEQLKARRDGLIAARDQTIANVNSIIGQIALLDELIVEAEKPQPEPPATKRK